MFKKFLKEKNGGLFEYIAIVAIAAVAVSMSFPGLRTDEANWFTGTTSQANTGISGTTTTTSTSAWNDMNNGGSGSGSGSVTYPYTTLEDFEGPSYTSKFPISCSGDPESYCSTEGGVVYQGKASFGVFGGEAFEIDSTATITLTIPSGHTGTISFYYDSSDDPEWDTFDISLDNKYIVSASSIWQHYQSGTLAAGTHTLLLDYYEDDGESGLNGGLIDNLSLTVN